jgi:hypothetical protein
MGIGIKVFQASLLLGGIATLAFAATTHADTRVCPPTNGAPWSGNNLVQSLNTSTDCWLGTSYATATENVGKGVIQVGAGGGSVAREVWASSYNNGVHTDVRVFGYNGSGGETCTCIDTLEDGQWKNAPSPPLTPRSHATPRCTPTLRGGSLNRRSRFRADSTSAHARREACGLLPARSIRSA